MPFLTGQAASEILNRKGLFTESLDLGLTQTRASYDGENLRLTYEGTDYIVSTKKLKEMTRHPHTVFMINNEGVYRIELFDKGYYQLMYYHDSPTVEINGIRMHRTDELHPFEDSRRKVELLKLKPGMHVLDTCMGLGYTAIWAKRAGAIVTTIEKSSAMLEIAKINPWSKELLSGIDIRQGDAMQVIQEMNEEFDAIIHDPPTFALATHLYSNPFYELLYQHAKQGAMMFHYVGRPGDKYRGKGIYSGVLKRLPTTGWQVLEESNLGVLCKRI